MNFNIDIIAINKKLNATVNGDDADDRDDGDDDNNGGSDGDYNDDIDVYDDDHDDDDDDDDTLAYDDGPTLQENMFLLTHSPLTAPIKDKTNEIKQQNDFLLTLKTKQIASHEQVTEHI